MAPAQAWRPVRLGPALLAFCLLGLSPPVAAQDGTGHSPGPAPRVGDGSIAALLPPAPTGGAAHRWIEVPGPDRATLRAVAIWPEGTAAVPVVLVLHGTEGFLEQDVRLAEAFAQAGFLGVAGCWFAADECPRAPLFRGATLEAARTVRALMAAAGALPRARADHLGLFGHSRGALLALLVASTGRDVQAVVASSAQHVAQLRGPRQVPMDDLPRDRVPTLAAPVLILHAVGDSITDVGHARDYERALREAGKAVEAHYYEAALHDLPFAAATRDDVLARAVRFFRRYLAS